MIDDRGKPPDDSGTDESVEILADAAVAAARRRPTRKLRVPNDPVPRRPEADIAADSPGEQPASARATDTAPDGDTAESAASPPAAVVGRKPSTPPAPERRPASVPPRPRSVPPPPGGLPLPRTSVPAPKNASVPPPAKVPSIPPPVEMAPIDASDLTETTLTIDTVQSSPPPTADLHDDNGPPTIEIQIPVAAAPSQPPEPSYSLPPTAFSQPPPGDEGGVVVRQVRRKTRTVGTGSKPPPRKPDEELPSVIVSDTRYSVPVPDVGSVGVVEDDFAVPPVEALEVLTGSEALRAPGLPNLSVPSTTETELLDSTDIAIEETPESDPSEVLDEPTEEITIPEEMIQHERPASARGSLPDSPRKPPAPPPTPPKVTEKAAESKARPKEEPAAAASQSAGRKKRRPWWEEMFNDDYFRTMPKYTPAQIKSEGDFIEQSLGVEKGAVVLDIACGDGRQAIELATRGYEMIALDLSLPMLSRAADAAQDREAKLNFLHSDMREMEFNEMFDAAYCTSTSFGFFDDERNADVAQRIHRALKVGGTLLLDVLNRDYAIQSQPAMTWFEADGCVCMEETSFDFIKSRLQVKRTMIMDDGRQKEVEASIRLYSLHELGLMLHNAGFRIVEVSGSYRTAGAFFGGASKQIVILAQKQKRGDSSPSDAFPSPATQPNIQLAPPAGSGNGSGTDGGGSSGSKE